MNKIISVDPGSKGGVAVINLQGQVLSAFAIPIKEYTTSTKLPASKRTKNKIYKTKKRIDILSLYNGLKHTVDEGNSHVIMENVTAMPGQGVTSMFSFGENYGTLKGLLHEYAHPNDIILVTPQKWKKHFKLSSDKKEVIAYCKKLYPDVDLKPTPRSDDSDGIAEAILIGKYFLDTILKK